MPVAQNSSRSSVEAPQGAIWSSSPDNSSPDISSPDNRSPDNSSPDLSNPGVCCKKCLPKSFKGVFDYWRVFKEHKNQNGSV